MKTTKQLLVTAVTRDLHSLGLCTTIMTLNIRKKHLVLLYELIHAIKTQLRLVLDLLSCII